MLDKIRLQASGQLPAEYQANLGDARPLTFDARGCRFLGISYAELVERTLTSSDDEAILRWAHARGGARRDDECVMWNRFMTKLGWRDDRSAALRERVREFGLEAHPIETFFDLLDFDEGRDPVRRRAWELRPAQRVVIMGVAGSGKTTVGARLAAELGWRFADADDFHPPENVAKMAAGIPLDDADRAPWIAALAAHADDAARRGDDLVLACSALRAAQRDRLVTPHTTVVYLRADSALLHRRLAARTGHFMKATMLDSQLAALEEPTADRALIIDAAQSADAIVATVRAHLER